MARLPGRLGTLVAKDLMTPYVVTITEKMTVEDAIRMLKEKNHSGAPVVDEYGHLVGTISVRDIMQNKDGPHRAAGRGYRSGSVDNSALWPVEFAEQPIDEHNQDLVFNWMRREPPAVTEYSRLIDISRLMCSHHMHRLPVVSHTGKLVGIITTMDILAALVNMADESSP